MRHGLLLKHRLGQNFLVNDAIIEKIIALAEPAAGEHVLEVGPGIGTLTVALLGSGASVTAIEADPTLPAVLAETCASDGERLALIEGDALKVDLAALDPAPAKLVSNLPYQVAATIILKVFEDVPSLTRAVVMVQAEVADRIAAKPGSKAYGAYTAKLALFGRVTGRFEVGPGNFMPPPHVDSAVVRIDRIESPATDPEGVAQVIDAAFAQRRKTIRNSMAAKGYNKDALDRAFVAAGIEPRARAETLSAADFVRLHGALKMPEPGPSMLSDNLKR
jgi:16S rRNA (adenine1518-N6/adenine1519-N6)-dimethyltransferase